MVHGDNFATSEESEYNFHGTVKLSISIFIQSCQISVQANIFAIYTPVGSSVINYAYIVTILFNIIVLNMIGDYFMFQCFVKKFGHALTNEMV